MKNIIKNKKKIMVMILGVVLLLVGIYCLKETIEETIRQKEKLGSFLYEEIHNLYFCGENIEYEVDENNRRKYIELENNKYYKIKNYQEVFENIISKNQLKVTNEYLNIKQKDNQYYMKDFGRGLSGYYGTRLKIKRISKNKIEYKAYSKFCEIDYQVDYGNGCEEGHFYEIEKPFIIVKEDDTWKVSEYTSVFEFTDDEIK